MENPVASAPPPDTPARPTSNAEPVDLTARTPTHEQLATRAESAFRVRFAMLFCARPNLHSNLDDE